MQKLTIGLVLIIIILLGIIGYIFASQDSQSIPNITLSNNSTNDSDYSSSSDLTTSSKSSSSTSKVKKNHTVPSNDTGNFTPGNSNGTKPLNPSK